MPGAVPITSTYALTNATLPYVVALAEKGVAGAVNADPGLKPGINVAGGKVTYEAVAGGTGLEYTPVEEVIDFAGAGDGRSDGAGATASRAIAG